MIYEKRRESDVNAMQFVYSTQGIDELKYFVGEIPVTCSKERHPGAIGIAIVHAKSGDYCNHKIFGSTLLQAGDYIVRTPLGNFYTLPKDQFETAYIEKDVIGNVLDK